MLPAPMTTIVEGVSSVTVHVRDLQKSRNFYRDVLGLREIAFQEDRGRLVFALPGIPTVLAMHVQGPGEGGREPGTATGVVFTSSDVGAACAEFRRRGGTVTMDPVTVPGWGITRAVIADPDGNEFVLATPTP